MIQALGIFAVTYLLMTKPCWPIAQLDRPTAGLIGAILMIAARVLTPEQAYQAIDWNTIVLLLLGFLVLPVRGVLYTLSGNPYFLVSVQILDGIGAGIFGVLSVLVVADLTRGTGRFNLTNGVISTAIGIGAALSNAISGVLVQYTGYRGAFLTLAAIAGLAGLWFGLMMPETGGIAQRTPIRSTT